MTPASRSMRVLVTRALFPEHLERLLARFEIDSNQDDRSWSSDEFVARLADKDAALITGSDRIDAAVLEAAPDLRIVCSVSVGYNHIDVPACTRAGVLATNTPDVLTETTADLGFGLMMAAARRITESERWLRAGHWQRWEMDQMLGADIHHATLGIIGMGRIGQAIARRARGFSMRVLYHNRSRLQGALEEELGAEYCDFQTLLRTAQHVILVLPYSAASHHLIGAAQLALMQPTATLTNIARGGLIDERALCEALRAGRLRAAGLDVFEGEPQLLPELLTLQNVALTPHIGSATRATRSAMGHLAIDNLEAFSDGGLPPCLLNPEVGMGTR